MENNQAISGMFLPFTDKELKRIYAGLESWGYSTDGPGVKKLLLEVIDNEEQDRGNEKTRGNIVDLLLDNPQIINAGVAAVGRLIKGMKKAPPA
jgi:hypothetical protein